MAKRAMPALDDLAPALEVNARGAAAPPAAPEAGAKVVRQQPDVSGAQAVSEAGRSVLTLRLTRATRVRIDNVLDAAKNSGDYRYAAMADLVRAALSEYFANKLDLGPMVAPGKKVVTTVAVDGATAASFGELPRGARSEITERVILAYLGRAFSA